MRGEEREKEFFFFFFCICIHTIPNLERYCSSMLNFLTFKISYVRGFLVFSVPNVKYLVFDILDTNALDISTNDLLVKIAMSNA